jgi:hypothetical protein
MITGKLYDMLKWVAQVILPAIATLYFTLAGIWNLPNGQQVIGTITAVDLFLGLILGISQTNFQKTIEDGGELIVHPDGKHVFSIDSNVVDMDKIGTKKEVRFKVKKAPSS